MGRAGDLGCRVLVVEHLEGLVERWEEALEVVERLGWDRGQGS